MAENSKTYLVRKGFSGPSGTYTVAENSFVRCKEPGDLIEKGVLVEQAAPQGFPIRDLDRIRADLATQVRRTAAVSGAETAAA